MTPATMPAVVLALAAGLIVGIAAVALFVTSLPALVSGVLFALVVVVALPQYARQRSHLPFGPANSITLFRAALTAFVFGFAVEPPPPDASQWWIAAGTAGTALLLDGVDGWVARRTACSAFGARFDMEIDALAALVLCLVLWRADRTGAWIILIGALRYGFVLAGWRFAWMRRDLTPSARRRAACAVPAVLLVLCLIPGLPSAVAPSLGAVALAVTTASFWADTGWLIRHRREPF